MAEPDYVYIPQAELEGFVTRIFTASGCAPEEAARISNHLVGANLAGHDSHGVVRVPRYVEWQKAGFVLAGQEVDVITDGGAFALLDGKFGFGQTVAKQAAEFGIERALAQPHERSQLVRDVLRSLGQPQTRAEPAAA